MTKRKMRTALVLAAVTAASFLLTGCNKNPSTTSTSTDTSTQSVNQNSNTDQSMNAAGKKGETMKTGKIVQIGGKYYIQVAGQQPAGIDSYTVNLSSYVNQTVKITGEYSGDTLFVGKIE